MARIKLLDKAIVDGKTWYSIMCDQEVARWLYKLDETSYRFVAATSTGLLFDIPESTYLLVKLVWSE
jgi:hypothetical protein